MARSNRNLVPASRTMLNQMKYEIAAELGLTTGTTDFSTEFAGELGAVEGAMSAPYRKPGWGHLTSRENGSVGGEITKRLVRQAEQSAIL